MANSNPDSLSRLPGKFIVFDGPDGCGKTTQMKLLMQALQSQGLTIRRLREPGGTAIGEQIRELLLSTKNTNMDLRCEMLLYMASRAQLVQEQIRPALAAGEIVLSDRYASSTLAYQGGGGGLPMEPIAQVAQIAVDNCWPDLTIIFDIDTDHAMQRLHPLYGKRANPSQAGLFGSETVKDRIESRDREYFSRVRANYLEQVQRWPDRYRTVDAAKTIKQVQAQVMAVIEQFFGG
jgi:dTMP kinase